MKLNKMLWCMFFLPAASLNGSWCCKELEAPNRTQKSGPALESMNDTQPSSKKAPRKGSEKDLVIEISTSTPPQLMVVPDAGKESPSSNSNEPSFNTKRFIQEIEHNHETLLGGRATLDIRTDDPAMPTLKALTDRFLSNVVTAAHQRDASVDELNKLLTRFIQYKCLIFHEELSSQRDSFFEVSQFDSQAGSRQGTPGSTPRPQAVGSKKHRFTISSLTRPAVTDGARKPSDEDEGEKGI